jgi:predicted alpha-1,2-mannosidase
VNTGRLGAGALVLALALPVATVPAGVARASSSATATSTSAAGGPAAMVDTLVGTGAGSVQPGAVDTFPGASMPFGMIQWSPDTSPDRTDGGGYAYADRRLLGFSLTHLSGPGCPYFGDVPILPVAGSAPATPGSVTEAFSHSTEHASPGRYSVDAGSGPSATSVALAVTDRTGVAHLGFGAGAGTGTVLFKASDSAGGSTASALSIVGDDEVVGSVTGGAFCTTSGPSTLYFVARFDRPFSAHGTWQGTQGGPGDASCAGTAHISCGGWVSFDTASSRSVSLQVAVSYVSTDGALANLQAEHPGWSVGPVAAQATATWNKMLGRIAVWGGSTAGRRTFYTALYHCLLSPNLFSDDDGQYPGFDHTLETTTSGPHYTNFSEWDTYRTQFPLVSMLFPATASDMVQSLLDDAAQTGSLPRWPVANSDAGQTDGDSADLLIAEAYAFGAREFDTQAALADMVNGATQPATGFIVERQNLATFLQSGYVVGDTEDHTSYGYTLGTSLTLEYSLDDFGISRVAQALGQSGLAATFLAQAQRWQNVFDPSTGFVAARTASGAFTAGPAFQPTHQENQGQVGFEEGNAIQYSWSVPQNLASLFALMGGNAAATTKLNRFFTTLNASRYQPYYWAGNEPDLWAPWEYDFSGAPWRTQSVVRRILDTQYSLNPDGEPGNDDLGAISGWYVWGAMGLYPVTPGTATLAVATPAFKTVTIHLGNGRTLRVSTQGPLDGFVHSARLAVGTAAGRAWDRAWVPASAVLSGGALSLTTASGENQAWGAAPEDAPASYGTGAAPAVGFTQPGGRVAASAGASTQARVGVQAAGHDALNVTWTAQSPPGVTVTPSSGTLHLAATAAGSATARTSVPVTVAVSPGTSGTPAVRFSLTAAGTPLPPLVLDVAIG